MNGIERSIGKLQGQVEALQADVTDIKSKVDQLGDADSQAKGGWKVLATVGTVAGSVGGLIGKYFPT